jgi:hypothetical protein
MGSIKNGYKLAGKRSKNGYDWWWHSFTGYSERTGEARSFFIEYYVINPGLSATEPVFGQLPANKATGKRPSYCMIKAGAWGTGAVQLHRFFAPDALHMANPEVLDFSLEDCVLSETRLRGSVTVPETDAHAHPEWMCGSGSISWDLTAEKVLAYDVGYGSSNLFDKLGAFAMYWHAEGLYTRFSGSVVFNGDTYRVLPETSAGYQDKNWGTDYTVPWIWLNCNRFVSRKTGKPANAFLDVGGGCPVVFGIKLNRRILTAFYYNNELFEFNFSKFWQRSKQTFRSWHEDGFVHWDVVSEKPGAKLEIRFRCAKEGMIRVNYENPAGIKHYNDLWNGGFAEGEVIFSRKVKGRWEVVDVLDGTMGGCEYGER